MALPASVAVNPQSSSASKSGAETGVNTSKVFNFGTPPQLQSLGGLFSNPWFLGTAAVLVGVGLWAWSRSRRR